MKPVFTQELVPSTSSLQSRFVHTQSVPGTAEAHRKVRTSVTVLGLALSLGASGTLFSSADAAESTQIAVLPSVAGVSGTLPSYGSDRPEGASATYHTVTEGETIWDIAKRYGVAVEDIKTANGIFENQVIQAGQVLKVPPAPTAAKPITEQLPRSQGQEVALAGSVPVIEPPRQLPELQPQATPSTLSDFLAARQDSIETSDSPATLGESQHEVNAAALESQTSQTLALLPQVQAVQDSSRALVGVEEATSEWSSSQVEVPKLEAESEVLHRVGSGETVWAIARQYAVDPEVLRQANNLSDADFIFPGDRLVVPGVAFAKDDRRDEVSQSVTEAPAESQVNRKAPEALVEASLPATAATPETISGNIAVSSSPISAESNVGNASSEAADPYVVSLLSDVAAATQARTQSQAVVASRSVSDDSAEPLPERPVSVSAEATPDYVSSTIEAVNPEFAPTAGSETPADAATTAPPAEDLLAAAPLGSEVYAPVIETPEGRVVSPEMPVLPGQEEYLPEAPNRFSGYIWPAQGVLTSGYGWRWGRMHRGVDIAGPVGTPIFAAAPGVVVRSGWNSGGYGNLVDIRHPDGSMTRYAHNSRLMVQAGQQVRQGQQIAEMGSTGYSTGPHLHFEIHIPDQGTVNPIAHLPGR